MAWLVAGLGNPGERYALTRHNAGRLVVDEMAGSEGERFRKVRFLPAEVAEIHVGPERVVLVRSLRYMNESGPSYASVAKKQGIDPDRVVAVHDELDLPAGTLRIKFGGGGTHNGIRSLKRSLGTPDFNRVRLGVGRPPGHQDPTDFLLERVGKRGAEQLTMQAGRAVDVVRALIEDGLSVAQDRFNGSSPG